MIDQKALVLTLTIDQFDDLVKTTIRECMEQKSNEELIGKEEMMKRLNCSEAFLNRLTYNHTFPHYKIGKKVLYNWREVKEKLKVFRSE